LKCCGFALVIHRIAITIGGDAAGNTGMSAIPVTSSRLAFWLHLGPWWRRCCGTTLVPFRFCSADLDPLGDLPFLRTGINGALVLLRLRC